MSRRLKRKIHEWLEEQDPARKEVLFYNIMRELEAEMEARKMKTTVIQKRVWIPRMTAALACCAAVLLVVWLPFSFSDKDPKPPTSRYCLSSELSDETLEMNLRDYSTQANMSCLYLDWYEIAEVATSRYYMSDDTEDTVYIHEYMMDLETGDEVNYYIMDIYTNVDIIENYQRACDNDKVISDNITVNWTYNSMRGIAYFSYDEYSYCVNIPYPSSEDILFQVVEQMLATAQK